jgi:hypothetical protein
MHTMAVKLNRTALEYAQQLIQNGKYVVDDRDLWSEHQPSAEKENEFIREHSFSEYAKWHLGFDTEEEENTKGRYKFPYGDFDEVHLCGVLAAEVTSAQYKYTDIESAAAHLHGMLSEVKVSQKV